VSLKGDTKKREKAITFLTGRGAGVWGKKKKASLRERAWESGFFFIQSLQQRPGKRRIESHKKTLFYITRRSFGRKKGVLGKRDRVGAFEGAWQNTGAGYKYTRFGLKRNG